MFGEYIKPLIVIVVICLVMSGALAAVNSVTEPVISEAAAERINDTMREIIPDAEYFESIDLSGYDKIPAVVKEVYRASNEAGYIFILAAKGYGGDINIMCAVNGDFADGGDSIDTGSIRIIRVQTLSHTETQGIGTIIDKDDFLDMFTDADAGLDGVDTVTGATVSTGAYIRAVSDVFAALDVILNS